MSAEVRLWSDNTTKVLLPGLITVRLDGQCRHSMFSVPFNLSSYVLFVNFHIKYTIVKYNCKRWITRFAGR